MRPTTIEDLPQILEWMVDYYVENQKVMPMPRVKMDVNYTKTWLLNALRNPGLISFISDDGVIMGAMMETHIGPNKIGRGGIWYVRPEARNGILAMRLLRAFDEEARERGALYAYQDVENPAHLQVLDGLYKLEGYKEFSKVYLKEF